MACVIQFPARRRIAAPTPPSYGFLYQEALTKFAALRREEAAQQAAADPVPTDVEILKLLRRIDRRLAKITNS